MRKTALIQIVVVALACCARASGFVLQKDDKQREEGHAKPGIWRRVQKLARRTRIAVDRVVDTLLVP
jgi:hypothetical protein